MGMRPGGGQSQNRMQLQLCTSLRLLSCVPGIRQSAIALFCAPPPPAALPCSRWRVDSKHAEASGGGAAALGATASPAASPSAAPAPPALGKMASPAVASPAVPASVGPSWPDPSRSPCPRPRPSTNATSDAASWTESGPSCSRHTSKPRSLWRPGELTRPGQAARRARQEGGAAQAGGGRAGAHLRRHYEVQPLAAYGVVVPACKWGSRGPVIC